MQYLRQKLLALIQKSKLQLIWQHTFTHTHTLCTSVSRCRSVCVWVCGTQVFALGIFWMLPSAAFLSCNGSSSFAATRVFFASLCVCVCPSVCVCVSVVCVYFGEYFIKSAHKLNYLLKGHTHTHTPIHTHTHTDTRTHTHKLSHTHTPNICIHTHTHACRDMTMRQCVCVCETK